MPFLTASQRPLLEAVSRLAYANPILPERVASERAVLGAEFQEGAPVWSQQVAGPEARRVNELRLEPLAEQLRSRLSAGEEARDQDLALYEDTVLCLFYQRYYRSFLEADGAEATGARWRFYAASWPIGAASFTSKECAPRPATTRATRSPASARSSAPSSASFRT